MQKLCSAVSLFISLGGQESQIHSKFSHHVTDSLTKYLAQTHQLYGQDRNVRVTQYRQEHWSFHAKQYLYPISHVITSLKF
jgi:hypothetical protein